MADRWIRSRFGRMLVEVEAALEDYRFDFAATALYQFTWDEFCAWYIELTKPVLQSQAASPAAQRAARGTLTGMLEALQRALHPLMPFITEEIWQRVAPLTGRAGPTVMLQPYPDARDYPADAEAESEIAWIQAFVLGVRQIRGEMNLSPARALPVLVKGASAEDRARLDRNRPYLTRLAELERITVLGADDAAPPSATALAGELTLLVPMAGLIDAAAEAERLAKRCARARQDLGKTSAKLANEEFVRNAPEALVSAERARAAELERSIAGLEAQLERVRALVAS
jgi:valyl-tRNA synthetase